jgi:hypothetical protein
MSTCRGKQWERASKNCYVSGYEMFPDLGDLVPHKSTTCTGFVFMLNGGAVSWGSKKQQSVATSNVQAEFIAASHAIKEGVWLGSLLEELGKSVSGVELKMDNMGCIAKLQNHVLSKYTKHIVFVIIKQGRRLLGARSLRCM